jgi:hypothetical protein
MVEYRAHVRDVAYLVRDRLVRALVEEEPESPPLYREERVALGLYERDEAATVAGELLHAAELVVRTLAALDEDQWRRKLHYGYPTGALRTIQWTAAQVLHEFEHHGDDIEENAELLAGGLSRSGLDAHRLRHRDAEA